MKKKKCKFECNYNIWDLIFLWRFYKEETYYAIYGLSKKDD